MTAVAAERGKRALERVLRIMEDHPERAGKRAAASLRTIIERIDRSAWPEVAWQFSSLTGDGFPAELTFSTRDEEIRYTCEVAGPEIRSEDRLRLAFELIREPPGEALAFLESVQRSGPLRFGAWIGGRHGPAGDRFKIYAEAPLPYCPAADQRITQLVGTRDLLSHRATPLQMIGYEPASSRFEFYFKTVDLERWEVTLLLRNLGLAGCDRDLFAFMEKVRGEPIGDRLPGSNSGFSLARQTPDGPLLFSLLVYARSLWGGDSRIRRRLLEIAPELGWDCSAYRSISEPLASRNDARTCHGIAAFTISPLSQPSLQIGLRPPEASHDSAD